MKKNFLFFSLFLILSCKDEELIINNIQATIDGKTWVGNEDVSFFTLTETDRYKTLDDGIAHLYISLISDSYAMWLSGPMLIQDSLKIVQGLTLELTTFSGTIRDLYQGNSSIPTKFGYLTNLALKITNYLEISNSLPASMARWRP